MGSFGSPDDDDGKSDPRSLISLDDKFLSVSFHIPVELPGRDLVEKFSVLTCVALDFLWALGIVGSLFDKKKMEIKQIELLWKFIPACRSRVRQTFQNDLDKFYPRGRPENALFLLHREAESKNDCSFEY